MRVLPILALLALVSVLAAGCSADPDIGKDEQYVTVVTNTELTWAQYLANIEYAQSYEPVCVGAHDDAPRVIVTGFGRFLSNSVNASGQVVAGLLDELEYPMTEPPAPGLVDDPAPQTAVALGERLLPSGSSVQICAMVLPVYWDLAAMIVLEEIAAFSPDLVIMGGIAGGMQPLWLELGSVNQAMGLHDGSGTLEPIHNSPLVPDASEEEYLRGLLLSWATVRYGAEVVIAERAGELENGRTFGEIMRGVRYMEYPRSSNTYLCNNTTYTVGYLMDHPGEAVRLLVPSEPREGFPAGLDVQLDEDLSEVPRVFVHWPSQLRGTHLDIGTDVLEAMIDAQLGALASETDLPTRGDNSLAD
ncbi:MAG: hypothetical protein JRI23_27130 [Deltaproteobacteria bacterium]|jgi:pyrrolidone-carboxylate peptidase|nr:hypothetical protein [Deltaproteobacteria bacterium]MBW2535756.1 hypothetical protein [Deltaproteobacteria bacterium]